MTDIEILAVKILMISMKEAKLLRFEACYRKVYNFCIENKKNPKKIVQLIDNIKQKIINDIVIIKSKNILMLRDIMSYYTVEYNKILNINDDEHFVKIFQNTNKIVKKKRKIIRRYLTQMYNKRIPEDVNNIIYNYI